MSPGHSHFGNLLEGREGIHPLRSRAASISTFTPMAGAIGVPISPCAGECTSNRT